MIKIAVIDDDNITLNQISKFIKETINEEIILDNFKSGIDFFQKMDKLIYDIVFLDIDMPEMNGFELAETLKFVMPEITIVFVSNLEHLVFQSFQFNPFRFVRKSCLAEDIISTVSAYKKELDRIKDVYFFKTIEADRIIPTYDIIYFESMGHDIYVHTVKEKYKLKREREKEVSIKTLSKQFETKGFFRVHRSFLVNFRHIYMINKNSITLKNKISININPHKFKEIKNIYQQFLMME